MCDTLIVVGDGPTKGGGTDTSVEIERRISCDVEVVVSSGGGNKPTSSSCRRQRTYDNEQITEVEVGKTLDGESDRPRHNTWKKWTRHQLTELGADSLRHIAANLTTTVEAVSGELVILLQERHYLQEEVDIRNIAIEQLLKVQRKLQLTVNS